MEDNSCSHDPSGLFLRLHYRSCSSITVQWSYVREEDWMPVDHFLLEYNSTGHSEYVQIDLAPSERVLTIEDCVEKTKHSITLTAIDINGNAIIRSKPLVVETSGQIERPVLQLLHNEPGAITIAWDKPKEYGDAKIKEYCLQVNGKDYARIISTQNQITFTECRSLRTYTFKLEALSTIHECDSEPSLILDVTCPGALPTTLERAHSKSTNKVKVAWNKPICQGDARVREYRIYYYKVDNLKERPRKDAIVDSSETILHTLPPSAVEDSVKVDRDKYYWAFLEAEIVPDGCANLDTPLIKLHATKKPISPDIDIDIYGLNERVALGKEMAYLLDKRDRLKKNINAMINSVLAKGERVNDEEVQRRRVLLYRMEKRLEELLHTMNQFTGTVSAVVRWKTPKFDEFSEPMGYRILVNNEIFAENLPLDTTQFCMKLNIDEPSYKISVTTLSAHSVGHGAPSETIEITSSEFRPVRFFCYFGSHNRHASWPNQGGCCLEDILEYERQSNEKTYPHRSYVNERVHAASFDAMGVFDGVWEPLGKHFGGSKPTALLFWTKWCASSKRAMEYYTSFAKTHSHEFRFLTCCVFSEERMANHQAKVVEVMTNNNWNKDEGVQHFCACHPGPNSKLRKRDVENSSFAKFYKLLGVPTLVLIDGEGYIAWQGRIFGDNAETFAGYLTHTFSMITKSDCPIKHCEHCDSETYGVLYTERKKRTFTGKDFPIERFDTMMKDQMELMGSESLTTYTKQTGNPAIRIGAHDDCGVEEIESVMSATTRSVRSVESHSPTLDRKTSRCSSRVSRESSQTELESTWPNSHKVKEGSTKGQSGLKLSKSVGFQEGSDRSTQNSPSIKRSETDYDRRVVSALPNIGRTREKVLVPVRPKTAASTSTLPKRSNEYDWVTSHYAPNKYTPYNPYRGASYAKNGSFISLYSKCGYLPRRPFPVDKGFPKVNWESNKETKKQKVPSHREIKYMRDKDWR